MFSNAKIMCGGRCIDKNKYVHLAVIYINIYTYQSTKKNSAIIVICSKQA